MADSRLKGRKPLTTAMRRAREIGMILKGIASTDHPIMAHLIPIRRCNLSCTYCNEYDDFSKPIPLDTIRERIDQLADLGTSIVTLSGGEPLLHPDLDDIIRRMRERGVIAGMITNGYLLTADRIKRLNDAGLDHMQISIDNVMPDDVSKKSLKVLDKKLQLLSEHSNFHVNINSVLGGGIHNPEDALVVSKRAIGTRIHFHRRYHPRSRRSAAASRRERNATSTFRSRSWRRRITPASTGSRNRSPGAVRTIGGAARAPAISTSAKTAWFTIARSSADIPASRWPSTRSTISGASTSTEKGCAPYCTVSCVHQVSYLDFWRAPQTIKGPEPVSKSRNELVQLR